MSWQQRRRIDGAARAAWRARGRVRMLFDESKTVETRRDEAGRERARGVVEGGTVEQRTTREEDDA